MSEKNRQRLREFSRSKCYSMYQDERQKNERAHKRIHEKIQEKKRNSAAFLVLCYHMQVIMFSSGERSNLRH